MFNLVCLQYFKYFLNKMYGNKQKTAYGHEKGVKIASNVSKFLIFDSFLYI